LIGRIIQKSEKLGKTNHNKRRGHMAVSKATPLGGNYFPQKLNSFFAFLQKA